MIDTSDKFYITNFDKRDYTSFDVTKLYANVDAFVREILIILFLL